jgi:GTP-binding protein EngB required for normal cell division
MLLHRGFGASLRVVRTSQASLQLSSVLSLSTSSVHKPFDSVNQDDGKSKAKAFRSINPDSGVLKHLDSLKLGFVAKRKARVALAKRKEHEAANPVGYQGGKAKDEREYQSEKESRTAREKRQIKAAGKVVDAMPLTLYKRPYPFNSPGRAMIRLTQAADIRTEFSTAEIAVIGRSNVGKSTLINNLLGHDASYVQRSEVSDKPGHTQHLHLYALGGSRSTVGTLEASSDGESIGKAKALPSRVFKAGAAGLVVCDMPGYGFAFMKPEEKERCEALIRTYLSSRGRSLKRVLLLLDARHGFKKADIEFLTELYDHVKKDMVDSSSSDAKGAAMKPHVSASGKKRWPLTWKLQVVLTKCDLLERTDLARTLQDVRQTMFDIIPSRLCSDLPVLPISGLANKGTKELLADLASLVPASHKPSIEVVKHRQAPNKNMDRDWLPWPTPDQLGTQKMPKKLKIKEVSAENGPNRRQRRAFKKQQLVHKAAQLGDAQSVDAKKALGEQSGPEADWVVV